MNEVKIKNKVKDEDLPPRVFLLNFAGHDISDALRFGNIIPLTEGSVDIFHVDRLRTKLKKKLETGMYRAGVDFIAISGSPVLGLLVGIILTELPGDLVNLLIWDAKQQLYIRRTFKK